MRVTAIRCPQCDASLDADADATVVACKYCGTSVRLESTRAQPTVQPPIEFHFSTTSTTSSSTTYSPTARRTSKAWVGLSVLIAVAFAVLPMVLKHSRHSTGRLRWDGEPPHMVDVNGDGIKDIVGKVDRYDKGSHLYIVRTLALMAISSGCLRCSAKNSRIRWW